MNLTHVDFDDQVQKCKMSLFSKTFYIISVRIQQVNLRIRNTPQCGGYNLSVVITDGQKTCQTDDNADFDHGTTLKWLNDPNVKLPKLEVWLIGRCFLFDWMLF